MIGWRCLVHTVMILVLGHLRVVDALDLDISSDESIREVASAIAYDMVSFYTGNRTGGIPGNLPLPYYWWEAGAMFGSLIDYWYYTNDDTYNDIVTQGLLWQAGPHADFMPPNQTKTEGNDDQAFWALAVMSAAETNFPNPSDDQPQWLALAQAVFQTQVARWDMQTCGGGLRWQIFTFNKGYNYKNAISNGCFFNLAARLAKYTGNETYAEWAVKAWDWMAATKLLDDKYYIFDGTDSISGCSTINRVQFTYNAGAMLLGAAVMYNYTNGTSDSSEWETRVNGLLNGTEVFFPGNDTMVEVACESLSHCDVDQTSFKAYLARWLAATTKMAPWTYDSVMTKIKASAQAAAKQCSGGVNERMCGMQWTMGSQWDGSEGVGQQMAALEIVQSNLIAKVQEPVTSDTGGTSKGDVNAGTKSDIKVVKMTEKAVVRDKAGSWILTIVVISLFISLVGWACHS